MIHEPYDLKADRPGVTKLGWRARLSPIWHDAESGHSVLLGLIPRIERQWLNLD